MKLLLLNLQELIFVVRVCIKSQMAFDCLSFGVLNQEFGGGMPTVASIFSIGVDLTVLVMIRNAGSGLSGGSAGVTAWAVFIHEQEPYSRCSRMEPW
jgi:hypothetical protein